MSVLLKKRFSNPVSRRCDVSTTLYDCVAKGFFLLTVFPLQRLQAVSIIKKPSATIHQKASKFLFALCISYASYF